MNLVTNDKHCYGCRACEQICPRKAITMVEDEYGFVYPKIDEEKCIKCGLCQKTCPINFDSFTSPKEVKAYVGTHKSEDNIYRSSSGGAFTSMCEALLKENYIIYGVKFDENFKVVHDEATTLEECDKFRKSKYILSNTNGAFSKIQKQLKEGKKVLFTGSPCQCAALKMYLKATNTSEDNVIIVNILCHGAGSQAIFDSYKEELEKRNKDKLKSYKFRSKEKYKGTYNSRSVDMIFENKELHLTNTKDPFLLGYYNRLFYRDSCVTCNFAKQDRASDITIGDAWKIEQLYPDYNELKGCSLILANTQKGQELVKKMQKTMDLKEISSEWALTSQGVLNRPTEMHKNREKFLELYKKHGTYKAVYKSLRKDIIMRKLRRLKQLIVSKIKK